MLGQACGEKPACGPRGSRIRFARPLEPIRLRIDAKNAELPDFQGPTLGEDAADDSIGSNFSAVICTCRSCGESAT